MTERERLIELIQNAVNGCARHWAEIIADHLIANNVTEVRHGEWIKLDGEWREQNTNRPLIVHQCSCCGTFYQNAPYNYCPTCGAKMKGGEEE
jgi:rubrerythrin